MNHIYLLWLMQCSYSERTRGGEVPFFQRMVRALKQKHTFVRCFYPRSARAQLFHIARSIVSLVTLGGPRELRSASPGEWGLVMQARWWEKGGERRWTRDINRGGW